MDFLLIYNLHVFNTPLNMQNLLVRHLLDPMHIEVNVAKALFKHIYGELDNKKVRKDCKVAKVHKSAWLIERRNGEVETPIAGWMLLERILKSMNQTFINTRFPTYYGAKIKNSVKTVGAK